MVAIPLVAFLLKGDFHKETAVYLAGVLRFLAFRTPYFGGTSPYICTFCKSSSHSNEA
ncbi:hypothetical protein CCYS_08690 [Corynebacterium cystitidis DSM 20524]|uniref:Uncharacterized protein n=1 Tax=Corynebacterium cystitidis DSM 20524 TaxID=1121357 RepID=A0A1H9P1G4_9CORY|nr:hypothetical protein CCYS_08690 [Corynebacterium cystitidis DSM 20524]SER41961.1 hypothetical protein SAMN05661109_00179 [Corynebacterium cystitidis DSM 20524]SNV72243.1 Uncharacterised protein [Corynebacterium cystitidis]